VVVNSPFLGHWTTWAAPPRKGIDGSQELSIGDLSLMSSVWNCLISVTASAGQDIFTFFFEVLQYSLVHIFRSEDVSELVTHDRLEGRYLRAGAAGLFRVVFFTTRVPPMVIVAPRLRYHLSRLFQ